MTIQSYVAAACAAVACLAAACQEKTPPPPSGTRVTLDYPADDAEVDPSEIVRGTVTNGVPVVVLVHPLLTNLWYVQRLPSPPNADGAWRTVVYFGTEQAGAGETFEVVAIAGGTRLEEGQTLERLPAGVVSSPIVTVRRRK